MDRVLLAWTQLGLQWVWEEAVEEAWGQGRGTFAREPEPLTAPRGRTGSPLSVFLQGTFTETKPPTRVQARPTLQSL